MGPDSSDINGEGYVCPHGLWRRWDQRPMPVCRTCYEGALRDFVEKGRLVLMDGQHLEDNDVIGVSVEAFMDFWDAASELSRQS